MVFWLHDVNDIFMELAKVDPPLHDHFLLYIWVEIDCYVQRCFVQLSGIQFVTNETLPEGIQHGTTCCLYTVHGVYKLLPSHDPYFDSISKVHGLYPKEKSGQDLVSWDCSARCG